MVTVLSSIYRCDANIKKKKKAFWQQHPSTTLYLNLWWPCALWDVYINSYVHALLHRPPTPTPPQNPHPPPSLSSLTPLAAGQLFQNSFFHLHHLQEARRAQNNPNSPRGFSLSPHFSCAFFPWVTFAVTVFIPETSFTHMITPHTIPTHSISKTTSQSYPFPL